VANSLVIRLPAAADAPAEWITIDRSGEGIGTTLRGPLEEALPLAEHRKVVILAPASKVLRLNATIPLKGNARIRQALPYALEEQIAGDIDKQHFAFARNGESGHLSVAVVDKTLLEHWLDQLKEHKLSPTCICAESDALDVTAATISVLLDNQQVMLRNPAGELTVADASALATLVELFLDQHATDLENDATATPVNLIVYCDQTAYEHYRELWDRLRLRTDNLELKILADGALPYLAHQVTGKTNNVNLLQGDFAPKSELPFKWQNWRIAAILLASFLALNLVYKGAEYWQLSRADTALDAAASELLSKTFPGTDAVPDPWNELRARLGTATTTETDDKAGFAEALESLSAAIAQVPGIRMETVSFRSGALDLQLIAPDVAALDRLRQLIGSTGKFSAEIQSANPADDVIEGRINIKPAEAS
jgi:general secretion pathway protein L